MLFQLLYHNKPLSAQCDIKSEIQGASKKSGIGRSVKFCVIAPDLWGPHSDEPASKLMVVSSSQSLIFEIVSNTWLSQDWGQPKPG